MCGTGNIETRSIIIMSRRNEEHDSRSDTTGGGKE